MPYYPENRIVTNQQANEGDFITSDGKSYIGAFYYTFDGKYFTGTSPVSVGSRPLSKLSNNITSPKSNNIIINNMTTKFSEININIEYDSLDPASYNLQPTEKDYKNGKVTRYFAKQRNNRIFKIIEINKTTYEDIFNKTGKYNYALWSVTSLFWQITGPLHDNKTSLSYPKAGVIDTNQRILDNKEKTFSGIKQYLTDLTQFYKN